MSIMPTDHTNLDNDIGREYMTRLTYSAHHLSDRIGCIVSALNLAQPPEQIDLTSAGLRVQPPGILNKEVALGGRTYRNVLLYRSVGL